MDFCGTDAAQVIYRDGAGIVREKVLYRADEDNLKVVEAAMPWSFDADGDLLRLASEAYRIRLAHIFDPVVAIGESYRLQEAKKHQKRTRTRAKKKN